MEIANSLCMTLSKNVLVLTLLLDPILIHQQKQFANYHYFTSTLVGYRPKMNQLHVFGMDREKALVHACHSQFPRVIHLSCWLHFKENILNKLEQGLHLLRSVAQEFIADVMGNISTLEHGLVDAEDEEVFTAQLHSLKKVWNKRYKLVPKRILCSMIGFLNTVRMS